jgi:hypothetical protein
MLAIRGIWLLLPAMALVGLAACQEQREPTNADEPQAREEASQDVVLLESLNRAVWTGRAVQVLAEQNPHLASLGTFHATLANCSVSLYEPEHWGVVGHDFTLQCGAGHPKGGPAAGYVIDLRRGTADPIYWPDLGEDYPPENDWSDALLRCSTEDACNHLLSDLHQASLDGATPQGTACLEAGLPSNLCWGLLP